MLGFGGHPLTKSRRYSVTFGYIWGERVTKRRFERHPDGEHDPWGRPLDERVVLVLANWNYAVPATRRARRNVSEPWLTRWARPLGLSWPSPNRARQRSHRARGGYETAVRPLRVVNDLRPDRDSNAGPIA
jgi:replication initiator protein RepSA